MTTKSLFFLSLATAVGIAVVLSACKSNNTPVSSSAATEFVAADSDFADYTSWTQTTAPRHGPDPAGLLSGGAHGGNDSTITRYVYVNHASAQRDCTGQFPLGTIFVKQLRDTNGAVPAITAMAKRGGGFDIAHNGWEWFMLDPATNKIMARSDTLLGGMCANCHANNASKDYVFTR